jgi:hypothetical protein
MTVAWTVFVVTWVGLMVGSWVAVCRMTPAAKQRWYPRSVILSGVVFVGFVTLLNVTKSPSLSSLSVLLEVVPATALIAYVNLRFTTICGECGAIRYEQSWGDRARFCTRCGTRLGVGNQPETEASERTDSSPY